MSAGAERLAAVVLAGGAGTRFGGADKGLVAWRGKALVAHALERLEAAGVREIVVSANRNREAYAAFGFPVIEDEAPGAFRGPLAGIARALAHVAAPRLFTVPVDVPGWPAELPARLDAALDGKSVAACSVAHVAGRREPLFAVYRTSVAPAAREALARGTLAVHAFQDAAGCVELEVDAPAHAFANLNTPGDATARA
jgi:molybdopterin-guanine dinucleotide biosynthesis protein A